MNPEALYRISYGLYVVSSHLDGRPNGQIANTVFQVTSDPVMVAACLNKQNLTHEYVSKSGVFSVSVLERQTPMTFIGRFGFRSGRDFDKFDGVDFFWGKSGAPVVKEHAIAYIEARVVDRMDVRSHTLFVGEVVEAEVLGEGEPLTYADYHYLKKGKTPKTATVYFRD
ncbi:flavin reductase family protein [Geoglobus ahangari]